MLTWWLPSQSAKRWWHRVPRRQVVGSGQLLFSGRVNAAERKSRMNQQVASINHDFILLLLACMLHFNLGFRNKEVSPATSSWNTKMMGTPWGPWNDDQNDDRNSLRNSKIACWSLCIWGLPYTTVSYELIILFFPFPWCQVGGRGLAVEPGWLQRWDGPASHSRQGYMSLPCLPTKHQQGIYFKSNDCWRGWRTTWFWRRV